MVAPHQPPEGPAALAQPVRPDYGGAWVGDVLTGMAAAVGLGDGLGPRPASHQPWLPEVVTGARSAVLFVLDGLGWDAVTQHGDVLPTISGMQGGPITTVAPSTTAAGLTSIATGRAPADHGLLGYRIRVGGGILNVLSWRADGSPNVPDPGETQRHDPFGGLDLPVVTKSEFAKTGFTAAHLRGGRFLGWRTTSTLVEHCRRVVEAKAPLVYAYYDGVDKVAHEHGLLDSYFTAELGAVDRLVDHLLESLPEDTALVVTADHGQVQVGRDGVVSLDAVSRLVGAMAGEGRFRSLWARPGASGELRAAVTEQYGHLAWVFTRDQLFDEGWFGPGAPGATAMVRGRVGDVVLAARAPVMFLDPTQKHEHLMLSQHGSITPSEMLVPLLAARGRG